MSGNWFYDANLGLVFLVTLMIFFLSVGAGYWIGYKAQKAVVQDSQINTIQGAILALFGLLLAFTMSMASSRYEVRRQLVLTESNAIGTAYLRAQLLPEPYSTQIKSLLRDYVDARLEFYNARIDPLRFQVALDKTKQLQDRLWQQAGLASALDTRSVTTGLFIQSLNEVIDLHSTRLAAMKNRVPETVIYLLFIMAVISLGVVGYASGLVPHRNMIPALVIAFLTVVIIMVIIDLDRPRTGLILINQESMIQLQQSLRGTLP